MKSPIRRKSQSAPVEIPDGTVSKFSRLETGDLISLIESSVGRGAEVFRGFQHSDLDRLWVTSEMESQLENALGATRALKQRLETSQSFDRD